MRILLILLFIPFSGFSQTYDEIMSIKGLDSFKRVVIENSYQYIADESDDSKVVYTDIQDTRGAMHTTSGNKIFAFYFSKTTLIGGIEMDDTPYDKIYDEVKKKCTFVKIQNLNQDYACYECDDAQFKGTLGFAVFEGSGVIQQIIVE